MMLSQLLAQNGRTGGRRPARSTLVRVRFRVYERCRRWRGALQGDLAVLVSARLDRAREALAINGFERRGREDQSPRRPGPLAGRNIWPGPGPWREAADEPSVE